MGLRARRAAAGVTVRGLALIAAAAAVILVAPPAQAHPLDEVLQVLYVTPIADGVSLELDITPGVVAAPAFVPLVDTDGDGTISAAESARHAVTVVDHLGVTVDGRPVPLRLTHATYPDLALMRAGGGVIQLEMAAASPDTGGRRRLSVTNDYTATTFRNVVEAVVTPSADYPADIGMITHPDGGRTMTFDIGPATSAVGTVPAQSSVDRAPGTTASAGYLFDAVQRPVGSPLALLVLLGASALLGAAHALTPGHGKSLLAAYLVGADASPRRAVQLGGAITVTHTASVVLIGLVALGAGHVIVPDLLVPALELLAGVGVVVLGLRLLRRRWHARGATPHHDHHHDLQQGHHRHVHRHVHPHVHPHEDHHHPAAVLAGAGHGGHGHAHEHPAEHADHPDHGHRDDHRDGGRDGHHDDHHHGHHDGRHGEHLPAGRRGRWDTLTMGVSGGILPCPEALGVLLLAVAVHRTALGLAMIVAFSVGLAAVLVGLGLLLVTPRIGGWLRRRTDRHQTLRLLVPLGSAAVVTALGALMTLRAATTFLA